MGFLDSMKSMFAGGGERDENAYWAYVRCDRCGEAIIKWTSKGISVRRRRAATIGKPYVRLGTNWPSITSK